MRNESKKRLIHHNSDVFAKPKIVRKNIRLEPLKDISNWRKNKAAELINLSMPRPTPKTIDLVSPQA